jgi:glycosyltransferase involved in cell wall biosynthesis
MSSKPFVLLISSEALNPSNQLSSCFELNLASCLQKGYYVEILSISNEGSIIAAIKGLLRKPSLKSLSSLFGYIQLIVTKPVEIKKHTINNIPVKEIVGRYWFSGAKTPVASLMKSVNLGMKGFHKCYPENERPTLIHAHSRFLMAGYLAYTIKTSNGIPYVYTEHSTLYQRKLIHDSLKPYVATAINQSDFFTAVSSSLYKTVEAFIGGFKVRSGIVYNALDAIYQMPLEQKQKAPLLLNVASLDEKKNQAALIKAMAVLRKEHPSLKLKLVGEGPDLQMLKSLAEEKAVTDIVEFCGRKNAQEIKAMLDQAMIFVLPSKFETFGVVVIEALSRGIPIVATKCGGPEEYFEPFTGIMIEAFDEQALAKAIGQVMDNYPSYSPLQIRNYTLGKFGNEAILEQHKKIYTTVLGTK